MSRTGRMRKRITFLNPPGAIGPDGWPSTEWTKYDSVWAEIKTNTGSRMFNSDATQWQDKKVVSIRYRKDVTPEMRVIINGKIHEMESPPINDDERNQWLTIIVKEV